MKSKKHSFRTAFVTVAKITSIIGIILTIGFFIFAKKVINDAGISSSLSYSFKDDDERNVTFEEGALLRKADFQIYKAFSRDLKFDDIIYSNLESIDGSSFEIIKKFNLKTLRNNDCKKTRCLQYKVPFSKIPTVLSRGLIGIEDYRFLDHFGIDTISIFRAIIQDIKAGALVQGGSTLTQQLVKNLFFSNERKFTRKVKEAILAVYIDYKYDKTAILENYFNEVFWGSLNGIYIKGIQSASVIYFGKDLEFLNQYEAAILVSMLKGPGFYHPIRHQGRLKRRADFIYNKLKELKLYNSDINTAWSEKEWINWKNKLIQLERSDVLETIFVVSEQKQSELQYSIFKSILESKKIIKEKSNIANLSVKLIIENKKNKYSYYSRFERDMKKAINEERHQIGSTIKPIVYSSLINHGLDLKDAIETAPIEFKLLSGVWAPRESHDVGEEYISVERALQESLNGPVLRLAQKIGFEKVEKDLISDFPDLKLPLSEYPAQLLGSVEVSINTLLKSYKRLIKTECERVEPQILNALSDMDKTTVRRVVDEKLLSFKIFGKTGTTNNGIDSWFVGYDGDVVYTIWTGVEEDKNRENSLPLYGSNTSFRIFQESLLYSGRRLGISLCRV